MPKLVKIMFVLLDTHRNFMQAQQYCPFVNRFLVPCITQSSMLLHLILLHSSHGQSLLTAHYMLVELCHVLGLLPSNQPGNQSDNKPENQSDNKPENQSNNLPRGTTSPASIKGGHLLVKVVTQHQLSALGVDEKTSTLQLKFYRQLMEHLLRWISENRLVFSGILGSSISIIKDSKRH